MSGSRTAAALPEGEEKRRAVSTMFDTIAPRYDVLNKVMTFGLDAGWRRRTVAALALARGARVLDLGCGTGDLARELSRSGHAAFGLDLSAGMLRHARAPGAPLLLGDGAALPFRSTSFDGVVSGFALRNVSNLSTVLSEMARVLRPGGRVALLEVSEPDGPLLRTGHALWFRHVVPVLGALASDAAAYRYLPQSVAYLPGPARLLEMLDEAGCSDGARQALSGGVVQLLTATRRP